MTGVQTCALPISVRAARISAGVRAGIRGPGTCGSAVTAVTQAITLGVQGATGTLSSANRQQIVQNLQGIQSQLVQLANTAVGGNYLFGGTASTAPPYTLDPTNPSGVV